MTRNQDLNLLPIFDALIKEGQLSRAATRLSMSQPAVSKALQRLRLSFNDELFVRTRRGLNPTPRALELHATLVPALDVIRKTYDSSPFSSQDLDRVFNVSMNSTVELLILAGLTAQISRTAPQAKIKIHPEFLPDIPARLKDGRLDYAVDYVPLPEEEFSSRLIAVENLSTICAPDHPMAGQHLTTEQAAGLRHVSVMPRSTHVGNTNNQLLTPLEHLLGSKLHERNVACHASGFIVVPEIVATSDLVAIVPQRLVASRIADGTLSTLQLPIETPVLELYMFWHRSRDRDPAHPWFLDVLASVAATL